MLTFESLWSATAETLKAAKKPFILSKNKRACQAAIDSAREQKLEAEQALRNELAVVTDGNVIDFNKVLEHEATIAKAERAIDSLSKIENSFFN